MRLPRYRLGARWYEVLSLEGMLYRQGRLAAVRLADPRPGDRVLDVGCGTGLSFEALCAAVGPSGSVTGIDASTAMLRQAARELRPQWPVRLVHAGAGDHLATVDDGSVDVVVFCYSLSIVPDWTTVWQDACRVLAPGGRIAVVDTGYPGGRWRVLSPFVGLLLVAGGVRPRRRVWRLVARDLDEVVECSMKGGHVRLAVGTGRAMGRTSR